MLNCFQYSSILIFLFFSFIKIGSTQSFEKGERIGNESDIFVDDAEKDSNSGIYVTGSFGDTLDFDPSSTTVDMEAFGEDIYLAKYDTAWNHEWVVTMGKNAEPAEIELDGNGNIYMTGYFEDSAFFASPNYSDTIISQGGRDVFLAKYDTSGGFHWVVGIGGSNWDQGYDLAPTGNGEVFVTGIFEYQVDFDPSSNTNTLTSKGDDDVFLAKYDSSGSYLWAKNMGGSYKDWCKDLALAPNGDVIITGSYESDTADFDPSSNTKQLINQGSEDIFLARYGPTGSLQWAKGLGSDEDDYGNKVKLNSSGNIFLVSGFYETGFVDSIDLDPSSNSKKIIASGGFYAVYDGSGNYIRSNNSEYIEYKDLFFDGNGDFYLMGLSYSSKVDCDLTSDTAYLNREDLVVSKYSESFDHLWTMGLGKVLPGYLGRSNALIGTNGDLYVAGNFGDSLDLDPSASSEDFASAGYKDMFLAKYDTSCSTPSPSFEFSKNNSVIQFNTTTEVAGEWIWDFGDGSSANTINPSHQYSSSGQYEVCATFESECGVKTSCDSITLNSTGQKEDLTDRGNLKVYPNPAEEKISITYPSNNSQDTRICLVDMTGRMLRSKDISESGQHSVHFDLKGVPNGFYLLKLRDEKRNKVLTTKKVVVSK